MTVGVQIKMWLQHSPFQEVMDIFVAMCITAFITWVPCFMIWLMTTNRHKLISPKFYGKWSIIYGELHIHRSKWTVFYLPLFLFRRILFVMIPSFIYMFPCIQLQILVLFSSFYIIYYEGQRPHKVRGRQMLEIFNEVLIMMAIYHMFLFTQFNFNLDLQFFMGYSLVGLVGLLVVVNIGVMILIQIENF